MRPMTLSLAVFTYGIAVVACGGGKSGDGGTNLPGTGGSGTAGSGGGLGTGGAGSASDAAVTPGTKASADFVARYIPAACRLYVCMTMSADVEACRNDVFNPGFYLPALVQGIDSGRILYDASKGGVCFDSVASLPCDGTTPITALGECVSAIKGTVPAGGPCVTSLECADRACHKRQCSPGGCCLGTCGRPFERGSACQDSDDCNIDDYCGYGAASAAGRICRAYEGQGQPCDSSSFCQSHLDCDVNGSHTCVPRIKDGEACTLDGVECQNAGSYCDTVTGKCRPRLPVGAACAIPAGARGRYDVGCPIWSACIDGVCTGLPAVGASCSIPDGGRADYACRFGGCINGTCQNGLNRPCTIETAQSGDAGARD